MTRNDLKSLEATLWQSADTLRANSDLKSTEYSTPVLGLIFLKFADNKYSLPFFTDIHDMLRSIDKKVRHFEKDHPNKKETKTVKTELEALHQEIKDAEYFFNHINWLQERFPQATYEDVTGLCKLATIDEVKEQDYSLNPGRYVGVVIEEDGKTEEEFLEDLLAMNQELNDLNREARELEKIIHHNVLELTGEK